MHTNNRPVADPRDLQPDAPDGRPSGIQVTVQVVRPEAALPSDLDEQQVATFLHEALTPWNDTLSDIRRGLAYARSRAPGRGGQLLLVRRDGELVGACVLLRTGMGGYVPGWLLLFVAVSPRHRGLGIG